MTYFFRATILALILPITFATAATNEYKPSDHEQFSAPPVRLVSFTASQEGDLNHLQWTVISEENVAGYEVQKSSDGINFKAVGYVKAVNSFQLKNYKYDDKAGAASYYRLLIGVKDTGQTFSNVIFMKSKTSEAFEVFPNPFQRGIQVSFSNSKADVIRFSLTNFSGNAVYETENKFEPGNQYYYLNIPQSVPKGLYMLKLRNSEGIFQSKQILKN